MPPNNRRIDFHKQYLHLRRSDALRLEYWLADLHERAVIQGEACMVEIHNKDSRVLVCSVDSTTRCIGCAFCGEFAAEAGSKFEAGFQFLHVGAPPFDVRKIVGTVAVLYCDACLAQHGDWFRGVFGVR